MPASRQDFLRFVSRLTNLISSYDVHQLTEFKRLSKDELPLISDLVGVLLRLEESSEVGGLNLSSRSNAATLDSFGGAPKSSKRTRQAIKLEDIFMDPNVFPTHAKLIEFGSQFLHDTPGKSTRERIARRFVRKIEGLPASERQLLEKVLRDMKVEGGYQAHPDFLARWEKVIKSGARSSTESSGSG
jgi:hypothetical protein